MGRKLLYGVGVNDSLTPVAKHENGQRVWICPFYVKWRDMIKRCYSPKLHEKLPTYKDCAVCDEWLKFSNFREWMKAQDWEGKHLDKDLIVNGNKLYSPETCIFISIKINIFTTDRAASRGDYLIGVGLHNQRGKFESRCRNPFTGKQDFLGYFNTELDAHKAWKARKHQHALRLAEDVRDHRLKKALIERYRTAAELNGDKK